MDVVNGTIEYLVWNECVHGIFLSGIRTILLILDSNKVSIPATSATMHLLAFAWSIKCKEGNFELSDELFLLGVGRCSAKACNIIHWFEDQRLSECIIQRRIHRVHCPPRSASLIHVVRCILRDWRNFWNSIQKFLRFYVPFVTALI